MFSVAAMPMFDHRHGSAATDGSVWKLEHHRPYAPSPLSSSPVRASSPIFSWDTSPDTTNRQTQSSPISSTSSRASTFDKFSRYAHRPSPQMARRAAHSSSSDVREVRRKTFLEKVRQRADERSYQRRDVEGNLLKLDWDREMRERELQKQLEGEAVFSEADIEDAAELLIEQNRRNQSFRSISGPAVADETAMLDAMMEQEASELDAMVVAYSQPTAALPDLPDDTVTKQPSSSDFVEDDDYDALFMELVTQQADAMSMDMDLSH